MTRVAKFNHKSASLLLIVWDDKRATVSGLKSKKRGKGHATRLLSKVTRLADTLDMTLVLIADSYGRKPHLNNSQLQAFYERHGFVVLDDQHLPVIMERNPR